MVGTETMNVSAWPTVYAMHDDYVELMPTWGYAASAFVLFLIGFFGFFLNLMVIILMCKDRQLWTPLNLILFNLVCSDFSVSILGNPFTLTSALAHRWIFGRTMCVIYGFFMTLLALRANFGVECDGQHIMIQKFFEDIFFTTLLTVGITSITTLTVLAFERYMMVSRPLVARHLSMRGAAWSVFCIWLYSFLVTTPPLFGWGNYVNEAANISCSINWEEQTFNTLTYIIFLFGMGLVLPVFIITFSYLNIIRTMKKNTLRMGRVTKAESRVTMMVFIMIVTFMIAWSPYSILALIEQFAPHDMVSPGLGVIPALVAKSSICYDPVIYVGMNTQFRASVKRVFGYGNREDSSAERAYENTLTIQSKALSHVNDNNIRLEYLNPNNNRVPTTDTVYQNQNTRSNGDTNIPKKSILKQTDIEMPNDNVGNELRFDSERIVLKESAVENYDEIKNSLEESITESQPFINENESSEIGELLLSDMNTKITAGVDNVAVNCNDGSPKAPTVLGRLNLHAARYSGTDLSIINESPVPVRRKSIAATQFRGRIDTLSDIRIMKGSGRRKSSSSGVLSGHTRKLSAAFCNTTGAIVTRIMVDEREKSKLMCFENMKANMSSSDGML